MKKTMALLGSWDWHDSDEKLGITVCEYMGEGKLNFLKNYFPNVKVGSPVVISNQNNLYFVHESQHTDDRKNEGGYAYSAKLDGIQITPLNRQKTYSPNPCYCILDRTQQYLLAVHHASTRSLAVKMEKDDNGNVFSKVTHDDAAVELLKLDKDGSIQSIVDYDIHEPLEEKMSLLHGVYQLPESDTYLVTDKGLNRLYTYQIDYANEKLKPVDTVTLKEFARPKYVAFSIKNQVIYCCYERRQTIAIVQYDLKGKLQFIGEFSLQMDTYDICGTQNIMLSSDEKTMYIVARGEDHEARAKSYNNGLYHTMNTPGYIGVYDLTDYLHPKLKQCICSEGKGTRSFKMTPDQKYILVFNTDSSEITSFQIMKDGTLSFVEKMNYPHPENISFFTID